MFLGKIKIRQLIPASRHGGIDITRKRQQGLFRACQIRRKLPALIAIDIQPGETVLVGSGIAVNIQDPNIVGIIVPRSGLGIKKGIVLANTMGVIDSDYQGEIKIGLLNRSQNQYTVKPAERICQMLFMPVIKATLKLVEEFSNATYRGSGGLGHTGRD